MDAETWMDANKAVELGFADEIMARAKAEPEKEPEEGEGGYGGEEDEEKKFPPLPQAPCCSPAGRQTTPLLINCPAKYGGEKPKADNPGAGTNPCCGYRNRPFRGRTHGAANLLRNIEKEDFIMTILELREKRAKAWEAAKAFLDSHRKENGVLSAEDDAAYTKMEQGDHRPWERDRKDGAAGGIGCGAEPPR